MYYPALLNIFQFIDALKNETKYVQNMIMVVYATY